MRSFLLLLPVVVIGALWVSACAPVIVPPPVVTTLKFPEFVTPAVPPEFAGTAAAINERRGWAFLQSGDMKTAEHEFTAALRNDPRFFPAETSLGYVELARKDPKAALAHFDKALERQRDDVAALFGRGEALIALNRESDALAAFESVLAADPAQIQALGSPGATDPGAGPPGVIDRGAGATGVIEDARRRVAVLRFRVLEGDVARARQAARAGRLDEAAQAYRTAIAGQPDSPFLYRELAAVERQQGNADAALEHFRRAAALDPTDARSLVQIGELLESRNDADGAAKAYADAAAIDPSLGIAGRLARARDGVAADTLPAEYHAIEQAPQVTRAELAALIGIRLGPLLRESRSSEAALITDVRNTWAQTWIMEVARAGVMEPFPNHAFQPRTIVRRSDLAEAAARLLARIGTMQPAAARSWEAAKRRFSDLAPDHLAYSAASTAVAANVMHVGPDESFQPSRPVTGAEAVEAIARLESLAGLK
jgi:tetratricopeptide (TPR) repeat protein